VSSINKKLIFPIAALAVLTLAIFDANIASANNSPGARDTLVQKIAEKFNLNQDDVQSVFDEVRSERQKEMQLKEEERLNQLVTDRKITKEQKNLIQKKQEELRSERESSRDSFKDLTPEERKAQMEKRRTELETWASENGIDIQYLMQFGGKGHGDFGGPRSKDNTQ